MKIRFGYYKDGKKKALTMSYDDGQKHDLRLLDIFNRYGIRGTFHLNSGKIGREKFVSAEDVRTAYAGHEVAVHTVTHPFLERVPAEEQIFEVLEDRRSLEALTGYPVVGMSYPYGTHTREVEERLAALGIVYSRTVRSTGSLNLPERFLTWDPTCHHLDEKLFRYLERLEREDRNMPLLYVWGHSYEFERDGNWDRIEQFCAEAGGREDVWYATNIEIYEYVTALSRLRFSADRRLVDNPSGIDVWISVDDAPVKIPAGARAQAL